MTEHIYCWLVYTKIWQNILTVDDSTLKYDKMYLLSMSLHYNMTEHIYCWRVYTKIWQNVFTVNESTLKYNNTYLL